MPPYTQPDKIQQLPHTPRINKCSAVSASGERALGDGLQQVQRLIDPLVLFPGGFAWEVHYDVSVR
jgi:hypothetical protein